MKKEYIIGGLALIGGIALVAYLLKPKAPSRNSEGFFNAYGMTNSGWHCETRNPDGSTTITNSMGDCPKGSRMVKNTPRSTKVVRRPT